MKKNKLFIMAILVFLISITGCSDGIKNEGNKIVVEKLEVNSFNKEVAKLVISYKE